MKEDFEEKMNVDTESGESKKKKRKIKLKSKIIVVILLIIAFIPIPTISYLDGGTRVYVALTYKIYAWNKGYGPGEFDKTKVYILGDYFKSYDELWEMEWEEFKDSPERKYMFEGIVLEIREDSMVVEPKEKDPIRETSDKIEFSTKDQNDIEVNVGDKVKVVFTGSISETYPAKVNVDCWGLAE